LSLLQRGLKRPAIDREEHLALLDEVAFAERRLLQLPGDLRADRDCGVRFDVADRGEVDGDVALADLRRHDGYRAAAVTASPATAATAACAGGLTRTAGCRYEHDETGHQNARAF